MSNLSEAKRKERRERNSKDYIVFAHIFELATNKQEKLVKLKGNPYENMQDAYYECVPMSHELRSYCNKFLNNTQTTILSKKYCIYMGPTYF